MRARAASLSGALVALVACTTPAPSRTTTGAVSPSPGGKAPSIERARLRALALRAARVWQEPAQPIAAADLSANPPGPDGFRRDEEVSCTFLLRPSEGWSPKFECARPGGDELKVKYGHNSAEVFGEVAATRLLSALGFGADRMSVVRSVKCRGCPVYPYPRIPVLDAAERDEGREVAFTLAAIERRMPGRAIKGDDGGGWTWPELDQIDPAAGGSSRAEVDALRLMGVFLNHWDNKAPNQRLICQAEGDDDHPCSRPFAYLQDLGQTFGPRGVDLEGWTRTRIWSEAATCRLSMKDLPYAGATFGEAQVTEAGRRFLGHRLRQLSHAQIVGLFAGARFPEFARQSKAGRDVENWAAAFEDRVRQIVDRLPCPQ